MNTSVFFLIIEGEDDRFWIRFLLNLLLRVIADIACCFLGFSLYIICGDDYSRTYIKAKLGFYF